MKTFYSAFCIAFSMYSALPMPQVDWNKRNMRYAFCFFPLIGLVIGGLGLVWLWLCQLYAVDMALRSAVLTALPLLLSGGIHMDGFCDTTDALCAHQPIEKRLEILKDPHIGAFGVIGYGIWLLLYFGLWSQLSAHVDLAAVVAMGFVVSRALSGLAVVVFPCAKQSGLAAAFSDAADKMAVRGVLLAQLCICAAVMLYLDLIAGAMALLAAVLTFFYYYKRAKRDFGGITGDLAGWFLQLCELWMLAAVVFSGFWRGDL